MKEQITWPKETFYNVSSYSWSTFKCIHMCLCVHKYFNEKAQTGDGSEKERSRLLASHSQILHSLVLKAVLSVFKLKVDNSSQIREVVCAFIWMRVLSKVVCCFLNENCQKVIAFILAWNGKYSEISKISWESETICYAAQFSSLMKLWIAWLR